MRNVTFVYNTYRIRQKSSLESIVVSSLPFRLADATYDKDKQVVVKDGFSTGIKDTQERITEKVQTLNRLKRTPFIRAKTQSANFRGNPLCPATKRHLNNS